MLPSRADLDAPGAVALVVESLDETGAVPILDSHALLDEADRALYQAKRGGRDRLVVAA